MIPAAVVGCGRMGAFTSESVRRYAPACWFPLSHCEAIRAHPALELLAVADADAAAVERAQRAHAVPQGFVGHQAMLAAVRPQLLGVATRTIGRASIIGDALAAGVRALHVEKPLCNSMAELAVLRQSFADGTRFLSLGAIRRHFGIYRQALALAQSGRWGPLLEIRVNLGAGALFWTQPHAVDLILFAAAGRPVAGVQARLGNVVSRATPLDIESDPVVESATIWFEDGVAGHITRSPGADLVLACAQGEVAVENDGHLLRISAPQGDDPYPQRQLQAPGPPPGAGGEGTLAPIAQLVRCLEGEPEARADNARLRADIFLGQSLLFGFVHSHLQRSRIVAPAEFDPGISVLARSGERFA